MRDAGIGGVGGEVLGRHQGNNAPTTGAGAEGGNPSKMHGKMEQLTGKAERGIANVTGSAGMGYDIVHFVHISDFDFFIFCRSKGDSKVIAGQNEHSAAAGGPN